MKREDLTARLAPLSALCGGKVRAVLLAFSGGADSRALLHHLAAEAKREGFALTLAHVNHGIRGEEALRDRAFCLSQAQAYGLELCVLDADVPSLSQAWGMSLEETARRVRYTYFEELMKERDIPVLATAHHADDHLETVLFRLARGTAAGGLGGIAPTRPFAGGVLVRPFLSLTRKEIEAYCHANALAYVTDSTNGDTALARNRIRAEVTPVLESLFEGVQTRVLQMSAAAREDDDYLCACARDFLFAQDGEGIPTEALSALPPPVQRRALSLWAERVCGTSPEAVHVDALRALIAAPKPTARVALPRGHVAAVLGGRLLQDPKDPHATPVRMPLTPGEHVFGEDGVRILFQKNEDMIKVHNLSTARCINLSPKFGIINEGLFWRTAEPGDRILMGGMHRRLCKCFAAAGIPVAWRGTLPLLCGAQGVLWAPGIGVCDGFPAREAPVSKDDWTLAVLLPDEIPLFEDSERMKAYDTETDECNG